VAPIDDAAIQRALAEMRDSLNDSESLVRTFLDISPQAIVTVDASGKIVWANHQVTKLFGYDAAELVGQPVETLVPEPKRVRHTADHAAFFADAKTRSMGIGMDLQARRKDGTVFPVEIGLGAVEQHGQTLAVAFVSDITERQRLHERERELTVLFDQSPDPLVRIDSSLHVTHANAANELAGVRPKDLIGRTPREMPIPKKTKEIAESMVREVFKTARTSTVRFSQPTPEGIREFEARYVPELAADGSVSAVYSIAHDITEQIAAQTAAQERERELTTLFDNSPDVIVRTDRRLRATYRNAAWEKVTGLAREKTFGKTSQELGLPSETVDFHTRSVRKVIRTKRAMTGEFSYPSGKGAILFESRYIPEFAADRSVSSVLTISRDVTEERRLQKLAEANARDIRALTNRLLTAHEEERRRISREIHDGLCQELGALIGELRRLAPDIPLSRRANEHLQAAQAHALRIADEARHVAHRLHPLLLEDLGLAKALQSLWEEFSEREGIVGQCRLSTVPNDLPLEVASCAYRVAQEALNNIAKHAHATSVSIRLAANRTSLNLSIRDNGVGLDRSAVRDAGGLGLVSMEERALIAGGKLTISGSPGHGTRVTLFLPVSGGRREKSAHSAGR